jgi:hypothetical protein
MRYERMKHYRTNRFVLFFVLSFVLILPLSSVSAPEAMAVHEEPGAEAEHHEEAEWPGEVPYDVPVEEIQKFLAPMNELDLHPCSDCHDEEWETDREWRELDEPHDEIPGTFMNHDEQNRWCLSCHSVGTRDKFQLQNGKMVEFNEYYRVCAQCHKRVFREWKMGVHGKRTGKWDGEKQWKHCAQCHNPHNPPFKPIKPMPAPRTPENIRVMSKEK